MPAKRALLKIVKRYSAFLAGSAVVVVSCAAFVGFEVTFGRPERGAAPPVATFTRFALANGLRVMLQANSSSTVALETSYRVGAKDDPADEQGIAHLAEHVLMLRSRNVPRGFDDAIAAIGGWNVNGSTGPDRTRFYLSIPRGALDAALWLERERMTGVAETVTQATLDSARGVVLTELARNESAAEFPFEEALRHAVFPVGHPYAVNPVGTRASLAAISLVDLQAWLKRHYTPDKALLVVAGGVGDEAQFRARVEKYFAAVPPGQEGPAWTDWIPGLPRSGRYSIASADGDRLTLVWPIPGLEALDLDRLDLIRHIVAPRLSTRLSQRGIASAVRVEIRPQLLCSLFMIRIDLAKPELEQSAVEAVTSEFTALSARGIGSADLRAAKAQILQTFSGDDAASRAPAEEAAWLSSAGAVFSPTADVNQVARRVWQSQPADLDGAFERWLQRGQPVVIREVRAVRSVDASVLTPAPTSMPPIVNAQPTSPPISHHTLPNGMQVMVGPGVDDASAVTVVWPKSPGLSPKDDLLARVALDAVTDGAVAGRDQLRALKVGIVVGNTSTHLALGVEVPRTSLVQGLTGLARMIMDGAVDDVHVAAARNRWHRRLASRHPELWGAFAFRALQVLPQPADQWDEAPPPDWPTAADVASWYQAQRSAARMSLIIASDVPFKTIEPRVRELFATLPAGEVNAGVKEAEMRTGTYVLDRARGDYAEVLAAVPLQTRDPAVARIVARVADEQVRRRLRTDTQISYSAFAGGWVWRDNSLLYAYADTQASSLDAAAGIIADALRRPDLADFCASTFARMAGRARAELQRPQTLQAIVEELTERAISQQFDREDASCDAVVRELRHLRTARTPLLRLVIGDRARMMPALERVGLHPTVQVPPWWSSLY
jgi:predicted Zn-dependent peptidase